MISKTIFLDFNYNSSQLFNLKFNNSQLIVSQCYFKNTSIRMPSYNESLLKITDRIHEIKNKALPHKLVDQCQEKKGKKLTKVVTAIICVSVGLLVLIPAIIYALYWGRRSQAYRDRLDLEKSLITDFG
ncbi:hypothetical protein TVAG_069860 [Trichomonas vaginalis G3]|uniref:Uncharacterized protein n=1 Tax=Trichomonas vaginalis (strain ATCC PRA-98 / G3) TaxID=412133 RepID=A2ESM7_TRIV3|nr:hypothetical protein TVAGG3_0220700 [Trichomonas vaginalis G3]EAY04336.1 hypothetical protein TVAG_069860 [Trichomonas vaginalis G3]KAI5551910.1 hypothetical protein TVAGG3_0220700 [Trichomonas vaginalis G3]|eukprot:XP_001316559.1 hypothetical protein [Trichomonas vaginalis G3]